MRPSCHENSGAAHEKSMTYEHSLFSCYVVRRDAHEACYETRHRAPRVGENRSQARCERPSAAIVILRKAETPAKRRLPTQDLCTCRRYGRRQQVHRSFGRKARVPQDDKRSDGRRRIQALQRFWITSPQSYRSPIQSGSRTSRSLLAPPEVSHPR